MRNLNGCHPIELKYQQRDVHSLSVQHRYSHLLFEVISCGDSTRYIETGIPINSTFDYYKMESEKCFEVNKHDMK
jgi:hypothetical protein